MGVLVDHQYCDNEACDNNQHPASDGPLEMLANDHLRTVSRHKVLSAAGDEYYFCAVCYSVILMLR